MKSTKENKVKATLKAYLNTIPGLFHYPAVAGPFSVGGLPDTVICYKGRFCGVEVKSPDRRKEKNRGMSALQVIVGDRILDAGGFFMVYDGGDDDKEYLKNWIEQ